MGDGTIGCPSCRAAGRFAAFVDREDGTGNYEPSMRCPRCSGSGRVPATQARWSALGAAHRKARVGRGESLMQAAARLGMRPAELSAMEQGRIDPAQIAKDTPDAPR